MVVRGGQTIHNNIGCRRIDCFKNRNETQSKQNGFEKIFVCRLHINFSKIFKKRVKFDTGL